MVDISTLYMAKQNKYEARQQQLQWQQEGGFLIGSTRSAIFCFFLIIIIRNHRIHNLSWFNYCCWVLSSNTLGQQLTEEWGYSNTLLLGTNFQTLLPRKSSFHPSVFSTMAWAAEPEGLVGNLVEKYKLDERECTALSLLLGDLSSDDSSLGKNNLHWNVSEIGYRNFVLTDVKEREFSLARIRR